MSTYLKRTSHVVEIDAAMDNSERARRLLFATTLFALTMVILLLPVTKITLDIQSFGHASIFVAFLGAAAIYCRLRRVPGAAAIFELMACGLQLSILGLLASYMAVSVGAPEVDIQLMAMEAALGFNGAEFVRAVDSNGLLSLLLKRSYASFQFQLFFLPCLLVLFRQGPRAYSMVAGFGLVCLIAALISIWYPGVSAYPAYQLDPNSFQHIDTRFDAFRDHFMAVAERGSFNFSLQEAQGILTFPFVHAGVACLCAWAAWTSPMRHPFLILNIATAVSALSHGSHYLVDVIADLGVSAFAIATVTFFAGSVAPSQRQIRMVRA